MALVRRASVPTLRCVTASPTDESPDRRTATAVPGVTAVPAGAGIGTGVTRFGAPDDSPVAAANVLLARAARHGLDARPATAVDTAAAVAGAESWMLITGEQGFSSVSRQGEPAARVLAAVLARVCGSGGIPDGGLDVALVGVAAADGEALVAAEQIVTWLRRHLGDVQASSALVAVAGDLAAGGLDSPFAAFGGMLLLLDDAL
jgi:hypothetical protein